MSPRRGLFTVAAVWGGLGLVLVVFFYVRFFLAVRRQVPAAQARASADAVADWKGATWALASAPAADGPNFRLLRLDASGDSEVARLALAPSPDLYLSAAPDGSALWLVTPEGVGRYDGTGLRWPYASAPLPGLGRPFWWRGRLSTFTVTGRRVEVWSLEGKAWKRRRLWDIAPDRRRPRPRFFLRPYFHFNDPFFHHVRGLDLKVVAGPGGLRCFLRAGTGRVRDSVGEPVGPLARPRNWSRVLDWAGSGAWDVSELGGNPVLCFLDGKDRADVWTDASGAWERVASARVGLNMDSVALLGRSADDDSLLAGGRLSLLRLDFTPGRPARRSTLLGGPSWAVLWPFVGLWLLLVLAPWPLAWALDRLPRGHRGDKLRLAAGRARAAGLLRRGFARAVDVLLAVLAMLLGVVLAGLLAGRFTRGGGRAWAAVVLVLGGLLLPCAAVSLLYVYWIGRDGSTPGRRLAGVRVLGLDLKPCGFWRAFLREALFLVDGQLLYSVGLFTAAATSRRQRVGDLVADTVVLRVGGRGTSGR